LAQYLHCEPYENVRKLFSCKLKNTLYNVDITSKRERKEDKKMEKNTLYVSDCCNAESNVDHEICSQCGEHCTIIADDSMEADYIPGLDDGEGI
jgi:hypothetical protein